jgi:allantoin racemase
MFRCLKEGPVTIDSSYDEAYAIAPTINVVRQAINADYDASILGCFCEGGVETAREISRVPVSGLGKVTLATAITLGDSFGILTEKRPRVAMKKRHVRGATVC